MKVILCGYNWTGCRALKFLLNDNHEVYVYTSNNPYNIPSLVDLCEKEHVGYTTQKIAVDNLPFKPDIICSIYYRYIIPQDIIDCCQGKIFNLHPALLPKYRGCSSLTWAMINGETDVGYTYHYIDKSVDTGKIIIQKKVPLYDFDTQETLYNRVMFEAMNDFSEAFNLVSSGYAGVEQVGTPSLYKRGCPYDGIIDDNWSEEKIERFIRAMIYPPYAPAKYNNKDIFSLKDYKMIKNR